jgi:hypothetical protein
MERGPTPLGAPGEIFMEIDKETIELAPYHVSSSCEMISTNERVTLQD